MSSANGTTLPNVRQKFCMQKTFSSHLPSLIFFLACVLLAYLQQVPRLKGKAYLKLLPPEKKGEGD